MPPVSILGRSPYCIPGPSSISLPSLKFPFPVVDPHPLYRNPQLSASIARLLSVLVPFSWHNDTSPNTVCTHSRTIDRSSQNLPYPSNLQNSPRPRACALVAAHPPGGFGSGRMGKSISGGIECQPYGHEIECILRDTLVESLWGSTVSAYYDGRVGAQGRRGRTKEALRHAAEWSMLFVSRSDSTVGICTVCSIIVRVCTSSAR